MDDAPKVPHADQIAASVDLNRLLPVIRIRKYRRFMIGRRYQEVVGVYSDQLLIARIPKSVEIPEKAYELDGAEVLATLGQKFGRATIVPFDKIKKLAGLRHSLLSENDRLRAVTNGRTTRFCINGDESSNFYRALGLLLGAQFEYRNWPTFVGVIARLALFFGLLPIAWHCMFGVPVGQSLWSALAPAIVTLNLFALIFGIFSIIPGRRRSEGKTKSKVQKDLSGKEPLRYRIAGRVILVTGTGLVLYFYGASVFQELANRFSAGVAESPSRIVDLVPFFGYGFAIFVIPCVVFSSRTFGKLSIALVLIGAVLTCGLASLSLLLAPSVQQFYLLLAVASPFLGLWLIHVGRSLLSRNARTAMAEDHRPPVLYLRSFEDDVDDSLTPHSVLAAIFGIAMPKDIRRLPLSMRVLFENHPYRLLRSLTGRITQTTEQQLANYFSSSGPFIAIGKPGERFATIGADRVYVKNEEWQQVVLDFMDRSRFVVLQAAGTDGFLWELRTSLERLPPEKILFCLSNFLGRQNDYEDFRLKAEAVAGWKFPRSVGNQDEPQFVFFNADRTPITHAVSYRSPLRWLSLGEVTDLRHTLARFVDRGQAGAESYRPRTYTGHGILAVVLFLTVLPAFWTALMYCTLLAVGLFRSPTVTTDVSIPTFSPEVIR